MQQSNTNYDLTGRLFGALKAEKLVDGVNSKARWRCTCACGQEKIVSYRNLVYGKTKSCGCVRAAKAIKDLTGKRFGRLVAQERLPDKRDNSYLWRCLCDCGGVAFVTAAALTKGQSKSCGCLSIEAKRARASDLKGKRFGRLTAIEPTGSRSENGGVIWRCLCDCGTESFQIASVLCNGGVTSCGCKHKENDSLQRSLDYIDGTCVQFLQQTGKVRSDSTSGVRGVSLHKGKWRARITFKKKTYYLGEYDDIEKAIKARKKAEGLLFGEFLDWYKATFPNKKKEDGQRTIVNSESTY